MRHSGFIIHNSEFIILLSPTTEQHSQIGRVYVAVTIEVGGAIIGIGAGAPGTQKDREIEGADGTVAVEIRGNPALRHTGRVGGVGPGLPKEHPVVTVSTAVFVHIRPHAPGPAAGFGRQALLKVVQIVSVYLAITVEVSRTIAGAGAARPPIDQQR